MSNRAGTVRGGETGHRHARHNANAKVLGLLREAIHRLGVIGVAAALLVQDGGDAPRPPIVKYSAHVGGRCVGALDEHAFIADRLLLGVNPADIVAHRFATDLHVADGMIGEPLLVVFPDADRMRHQFPHRRLKIVVSHDTARNARCTGGDTVLVDDNDPAVNFPAAFLFDLGQPPRG